MDGEDLGLIDGSGSEEVELDEGGGTFVEEEGGGAGEEEGGGEEAEGGEKEGEEEEQSEGGGKRVDRADLPLQLRKALRSNPEIAKQFPKLEKQITGALFKANQVDSLGGVQKLREIAETVESLGGPEGIAEMSEELENWRAFDKGLESGDPRIIDGWIKDYPGGVKALLPGVIEKLDAVDSPAADQIISAPMWKVLDRCGVITTLGALESAIAKLDPEKAGEAIKEFNLLKGFFRDLRSLAVKAKSPDPLANERKALSDKEAEYTEREQQAFHSAVKSEVNTVVTQKINRLIRQELNGAKLKLSQANRLRKNIVADLREAVGTDKPQYLDRFGAIMRSGNKQNAVRFAVSAADNKLPGIVRRLISEFNLKSGGGRNGTGRREGGMRSGGSGSSVVSGRPKTSDVDFNKTDKSRWLAMVQSGHGEAVLLNGKRAKW